MKFRVVVPLGGHELVFEDVVFEAVQESHLVEPRHSGILSLTKGSKPAGLDDPEDDYRLFGAIPDLCIAGLVAFKTVVLEIGEVENLDRVIT